ncbi:MAG: hypothetical protein GEV09_08645 [Pseudonocardiaceae bacterium]|nr:hypothetical protein [Pseudonocardiaceae bacterium]
MTMLKPCYVTPDQGFTFHELWRHSSLIAQLDGRKLPPAQKLRTDIYRLSAKVGRHEFNIQVLEMGWPRRAECDHLDLDAMFLFLRQTIDRKDDRGL